MISPRHFTPDGGTARDTFFQSLPAVPSGDGIAQTAHDELIHVAETLPAPGVNVHLFEVIGAAMPDSGVPNNWFSSHASGQVAVLPLDIPNIEMADGSVRCMIADLHLSLHPNRTQTPTGANQWPT
ncbi:arginine deiminase-related protein [Antarctobacter heliothermus]